MTMTNENLIQIWYNDITKQPFKKTELTRDNYMKQINYFLDYMNNKPLAEITTKDIKGYMQSLNVSDSTYDVKLASISSLYKILKYDVTTEDIIKENPTYGVFRVKVKNKEKIPLTKDEERALLQNCKNKRDYAIILTLLSTGLRINELINLTLEQYQNRDEYNGIELVVTKRSKKRIIYLNDKVISAIEDYLTVRKDGCNKLFVSNGSEKMGRSCLTRSFKNIAFRAGFTEERISQIAPHLMRVTCGSDMGEKGIPIQVIQKILGHSDINVTASRYVKTRNESIKDAMVDYLI